MVGGDQLFTAVFWDSSEFEPSNKALDLLYAVELMLTGFHF